MDTKIIDLLKRLIDLDNGKHIFIDEPAAHVEMEDILKTAKRIVEKTTGNKKIIKLPVKIADGHEKINPK